MRRLEVILSITCVFALLMNYPLRADNGGLVLPPGFKATVIADDLGKARGIAIRDNGDIYVSLLQQVDLNYIHLSL